MNNFKQKLKEARWFIQMYYLIELPRQLKVLKVHWLNKSPIQSSKIKILIRQTHHVDVQDRLLKFQTTFRINLNNHCNQHIKDMDTIMACLIL